MTCVRWTACALLLALAACTDAPVTADAGGDASGSCVTSASLVADWSTASHVVESCGMRVGSAPQPVTLCWRPCTTTPLAAGCAEADPRPWLVGGRGMERGGVGYFPASTPATSGIVVALLGDEGSVLAAFEYDDLGTAVPHACGGTVAALASDQWVVQLFELRPDPSAGGVYLGFAGELHAGALSDVAAWSVPRASEPGFGWERIGETTSSLAALAPLQNHEPRDAVLLDASGAHHVAPLHAGGWVYDVAGIVGERVVWLEDESDALIAVRHDGDGTTSTLRDVRPRSVAAMGLDGARWAWIEQESPWSGRVYDLFTAPADETATTLAARPVPDTAAAGWNTLAGPLGGARFGHGLAVLWFSTPDRLELRVVDLDTGAVHVLTLPPTSYALGVVVTGAHAIDVVHTTTGPTPTSDPVQRWLRIDTDALPVFSP